MKIALYARTSTELQEKEHTIESQIEELKEWSEKNNHVVIDKYVDEGYSGVLLARPELDRLRDDASKGLFDGIAFHSPDRLARKFVYQEIVIEELKNKGIQVLFLNRPIAETPEDQLLLGVQGIIAEYERAKIMERTRRGRIHKVKCGHILGNIPPYGYDLVSTERSETGFPYYKINEKEAEIVKLMFNMLVNKQMTLYRIIMELRKRGIKPRKGNEFWARSSVNKILRNETYTGITFYNKHYTIHPVSSDNLFMKNKYKYNTLFRWRPKEEWIKIEGVPEIIDKLTFLKAQKQLKLNYKYSDRNTKWPLLLGKGLIKCGLDSKTFRVSQNHGYPMYRCTGKDRLTNVSLCSSKAVSAKIIDTLVWNTIVELTNNPKIILERLKKYQNKKLLEYKDVDSKVKQIDSALLKSKVSEERMFEAYSSGIISLDQLKEQNLKLKEQTEQLKLNKIKFESQKMNPKTNYSKENVMKYFTSFKKALSAFKLEEKQEYVRKIIREIIVQKDRKVLLRGAFVLSENTQLCTQRCCDRKRGKYIYNK